MSEYTIAEFLEKHDPFDDFEGTPANCHQTMQDVWDKESPGWVVWIGTREGVLTDREVRLFSIQTARQVQHLMSPRSLAALDVAERHANGQATDEEFAAASAAALAAYLSTPVTAYVPHDAAWLADPEAACRAWHASDAAFLAKSAAYTAHDVAYVAQVAAATVVDREQAYQAVSKAAGAAESADWATSVAKGLAITPDWEAARAAREASSAAREAVYEAQVAWVRENCRPVFTKGGKG